MPDSLRVLLVTEGSGGHLIPALQVARALEASGAHVKVWYAQRRQTAGLSQALMGQIGDGAIDVDPIPLAANGNPLRRLWQCGQLWSRSRRCFATFTPDVVVGFGGLVSAPVVLAARWRRPRHRISTMVHEQNVVMGKANRLLSFWVDRVAVSFQETQAWLSGIPSILTGMPVRASIGRCSRAAAASQFGLDVSRLTVLVLGGSQGSQRINTLMTAVAAQLSPAERETLQVMHVAGNADAAKVREAYARAGVTAWVAPFLTEMEAAYAQADLVIGRAGASTIAELASCGKPAILIPYPHAGGHQRANAHAVEAVGGAVVMEEQDATVERLAGEIRRLLGDARLRDAMGRQINRLAMPDAVERLIGAIRELCHPQPLALAYHGH